MQKWFIPFILFVLLVSSRGWTYSRGNYVGGKIKYTEELSSDDIYTTEFSMREEINDEQWELLATLHMKMRCGDRFFLQQLSYPRHVPGQAGLIDSAQLKFSCHQKPIVSGETKERVIEKIKRLCAAGNAKPLQQHCDKVIGSD